MLAAKMRQSYQVLLSLEIGKYMCIEMPNAISKEWMIAMFFGMRFLNELVYSFYSSAPL